MRNAQIFKDLPVPLSDNVLLSITSQLTDLLATIDSLVKDIDEGSGGLKKSLLALLSLVKEEAFSQVQLDKVLNSLRVNILKDEGVSSSVKKQILELMAKLDPSANKNSLIDNKIQTSSVSSEYKDVLINVKGESSEKIILFNDKNQLSNYLNKYSHNKGIQDSVEKFNGKVLAHIDSNVEKNIKIHLFNGDHLKTVLKHISHKSFESTFMKEQMATHLKPILETSGELKMSSARILDSIIVKNFPQIDSGLSKQSTAMTLSQLLSSIESMDKEKNVAIEKLIPYMLKSITEDVTELLASSEKDISRSVDEIFNSINKSFLEGRGKDFFTSLFKLVGLDRESSILTLIQNSSFNEKSELDSLKTLLLNLFTTSEKDDGSKLNSSGQDAKHTQLKEVIGLLNEKNSQPTERSVESTNIREKVEQVINKIEALQVLAKKVPTPNGESQLLTVPVNINNEITELRVQFRKEKKEQEKHKK